MTNLERINLYEYELILTGKRKNYQCSFTGGPTQQLIEFGNIWRCAITKILKWTPEQAVLFLTEDIIRQLKLDKTYRAIDIGKNDFVYDSKRMLQYAFPDKVKYSFTNETIDVYEQILRNDKNITDKKDKLFNKFPKSFFIDRYGEKRASILLNYAVGKYLGHLTSEEKYNFFASKNAMRWLTQMKLNQIIGVMYENPLEYYHEALCYDERDELLYLNERLKSLISDN